jgi:hypothetical protein
MTPQERNDLIEAMKAVFPTREELATEIAGSRAADATLREEMNARFDLVPTRDEMNARFDLVPTRDEMNARFDLVPTRDEMNARFDLVPTRDEMNARFDLVPTRDEMRREIQEAGEETRRHFDVVAEDMRSLIQGVAEGIVLLGERMDARFEEQEARLMERIDPLYAAYRSLDTRVGRLEVRVFGEPEPPPGRPPRR